jgi:hypothetical protein
MSFARFGGRARSSAERPVRAHHPAELPTLDCRAERRHSALLEPRGQSHSVRFMRGSALDPGPASRGHGMGVVEEFVDRPLVVGVLSVLECSDPPVGSDQEIRRQPEAASGGLDRSERAALGAAVAERGGLAGDRRAQRARAQQRARPAFDPEPPVQLPLRVGDQRERQVGLVLVAVGAPAAAVEHDDGGLAAQVLGEGGRLAVGVEKFPVRQPGAGSATPAGWSAAARSRCSSANASATSGGSWPAAAR